MQNELKIKIKKIGNPIFKGIKRNWFRKVLINFDFKKIIPKILEREWICPHCFRNNILLWNVYKKDSNIEVGLREKQGIRRFYVCEDCKELIIDFKPRKKWIEFPIFMTRKFKQILSFLEKIANSQDCFKTIENLKQELDIKITEERVWSLDDTYIWIFAIKPFNTNDYNEEKERIKKQISSNFTDVYVNKLTKRGKLYFKYLVKIRQSKVNGEIIEKLKENYPIIHKFKVRDWEELINSNQLINARFLLARKLIASKIYQNLNLKRQVLKI